MEADDIVTSHSGMFGESIQLRAARTEGWKEMRMDKHKGSTALAVVIPLILTAVMAGCCNGGDDLVSSLSAASLGPGGAPINLGSAGSFGILAGQDVTNTGATTINADLGVSPGSTLTGAPTVTGTIHLGDSTAAAAQNALTKAYNQAAGRAAGATIAGDLGGLTLAPGVYKSTSSLMITSADLTLDAGGNSNAVFIFQIASTLTVGVGRNVILSGGAQSSNITWQVGSSATLGVGSDFSGDILALTSITLNTGATLNGRALARNGSVTLDTNTVTP